MIAENLDISLGRVSCSVDQLPGGSQIPIRRIVPTGRILQNS